MGKMCIIINISRKMGTLPFMPIGHMVSYLGFRYYLRVFSTSLYRYIFYVKELIVKLSKLLNKVSILQACQSINNDLGCSGLYQCVTKRSLIRQIVGLTNQTQPLPHRSLSLSLTHSLASFLSFSHLTLAIDGLSPFGFTIFSQCHCITTVICKKGGKSVVKTKVNNAFIVLWNYRQVRRVPGNQGLRQPAAAICKCFAQQTK